jgi:hypothetical protein
MTLLTGILTQALVDEAEPGGYLDGFGLWLVVNDLGGRRYDLRHEGDTLYVGDASRMTLAQARRRAVDMVEERELGAAMTYLKPINPAMLAQIMDAWVSASLAAVA